MDPQLPTLDDVQQAADRLRDVVTRTPVLTSTVLNRRSGAKLFFKCENFQRTGSFKYRGASNAIALLDDDSAARGVATHSSGNHGAALALAARRRDVTAHIVVPDGAVASKVANIERYGGRVVRCAPTQAGREAKLAEVIAATGASAVPPYDDARIIAGQGSCALELVDQVDGLDALLAPVGGGGLISGTALVGKAQSRPLQVLGAEPTGADDAYRSLRQGQIVTDHQPNTIADGLRAHIGQLPFRLMNKRVDRILLVDDDQTMAAMRLLWSVLKIVVEPSCATALAAVLRYPELIRDQRIGVILSGGNVDLDALQLNMG